jgi:hypothetical protein
MKNLYKIIIWILFIVADIMGQPAELSADNGTIKIKLDLSRGGAISYISLSGSERNLVNIYDEGRYIQQSYYAGKNIDRRAEGQSPKWSPWCWNPIQVGDEYHNRAKILDYKQSGDTLWVRCIPMQWDMNNKPAEAEMEQRTILSGNILHVYCKLTCHTIDTIYHVGNSVSQELPAVYPISSLQNLYTYLGEKPFTNDTVSNSTVIYLSSGFWGKYPDVPEHWMAFTDSTKWGMGVYNPICTSFLAGMAGKPGGESKDGSTSYIAPVKEETLNKNSVFEYDYYIIIGTVYEIRAKVYQLNNNYK